MPRFISTEQRDTYRLVARTLLHAFGDNVEASMEAPAFALTSGSAQVEVAVVPWRKKVLVKTRALLIESARVDFDLLNFLLRENLQIDLGAFAIDGVGGVVFQHILMGSNLLEEDITTSVRHVMLVADQYDDRIQQRWGGRRAVDTSPRRPPRFKKRQLQVKAENLANALDETLQFNTDDLDV